MHTPNKQHATHTMEACISVLKVIAHPEQGGGWGGGLETLHDQAFLPQ